MDAQSILVIDDSESAVARVRHVLETSGDGYRLLTARDGLDGFKVLVTSHIDLVVCDLVMSGMDGFKFLGLKRTRPDMSDIPVIMLTGASDIGEKVKALDGGAADYVTKPFHDAELLARVRVHLKVRALQAELREKNIRLEELSNTDGLTKLANRRHFMELAKVELMRAQRYDTPLSVVLIDLDHFKAVNDTYGHSAGDQVLTRVSEAIRRDLRQYDVAARYGGEELVLLLPQTDAHGAEAVAQRYRHTIEELVVSSDTNEVRITASFGVAAFPEHPAESIDLLLDRADAALYESKRQGRNRVTLAQ